MNILIFLLLKDFIETIKVGKKTKLISSVYSNFEYNYLSNENEEINMIKLITPAHPCITWIKWLNVETYYKLKLSVLLKLKLIELPFL